MTSLERDHVGSSISWAGQVILFLTDLTDLTDLTEGDQHSDGAGSQG